MQGSWCLIRKFLQRKVAAGPSYSEKALKKTVKGVGSYSWKLSLVHGCFPGVRACSALNACGAHKLLGWVGAVLHVNSDPCFQGPVS